MPWLLANFRAPFCAASWIRVFSFSQPVQQANGISHLEISSNFRQSHDFANRCESLRYKKHSPAILTKQFSDKSRRVLPSVHRLAGGCSGRFLPRLTVLA